MVTTQSHRPDQVSARFTATPIRLRTARPRLLRILTGTWLALILSLPCPLPAQTWLEDSFDDFADGRLDASGQNIYVSRDGGIRTIHRFDLNQDGHVDLIFNSTHDTYSWIPATVASCTRQGRIRHAPLAVPGSRQVTLSDLNNDGFRDAAFCPNADGAQDSRRFVTILWGGTDGWPAHRATSGLPVNGAERIAAPDLNADGWRDLVVLNGPAWLPGQPDGRIVRVYWGSRNGYLLVDRLDVGITHAIDIAQGDFDSSGHDDLAVLRSDGRVVLLWSELSKQKPTAIRQTELTLPDSDALCLTAADADNDKLADLVIGTSGRMVHLVPGAPGTSWGRAVSVRATSASHIAVGDVDGDRLADLVLTRFAQARAGGGEAAGAAQTSAAVIHVLWGDSGSNSRFGFSMQRATEIPARHASATAIGDLNADGQPDLAVAIHQGDVSMTTDSVVFFGTGQRRFERSRDELPTTGASHVAISPPQQPGLSARIVFCNSSGGTIAEKVPLHVYWGGPDGFRRDNVWNIPFASGYESTAADLNADGYTDLVAINSGHAGEISLTHPHLGVNIFWGAADGFDIDQRRTVLREEYLGTSNVADLNRDGFLDLVLGQFGAARGAAQPELIVYYGGADGFSRDRRATVVCPGRSISTVVADFDQDDWLDVAINTYDKDVVRIFRGGRDGFSSERQFVLRFHNPIDIETADLNADGHLDLIVGCYQDRLSGAHDMGTTIFWGAADGEYRTHNAQWLPGFTPIGHCVADFDSDGYLDLFSPHYHANGTRASLPSYLYWGGSEGFAIKRRTSLICDSADDAMAADFNRDGRLDLAVVCHAVDGGHQTVSKVFHNDGHRFADPDVTRLPTHGPHWMWHEDMGHIYHRRWQQTYQSSVFEYDKPATRGRLEFTADQPAGTTLAFSVRFAASAADLASQQWHALESDEFRLPAESRFLQYQATFQSDNGDRYAVLDRVRVDLRDSDPN